MREGVPETRRMAIVKMLLLAIVLVGTVAGIVLDFQIRQMAIESLTKADKARDSAAKSALVAGTAAAQASTAVTSADSSAIQVADFKRSRADLAALQASLQREVETTRVLNERLRDEARKMSDLINSQKRPKR